MKTTVSKEPTKKNTTTMSSSLDQKTTNGHQEQNFVTSSKKPMGIDSIGTDESIPTKLEEPSSMTYMRAQKLSLEILFIPPFTGAIESIPIGFLEEVTKF